jgi:hypothetical protein
MKQLLLAAILLLALPGVAEAKGLNGITLCGAAGCVEKKLDGFGHRSTIEDSVTGLPAPPPSRFYRLMFGVAPHVDPSNAIEYEPRSGLVALESGVSRWTKWERLDPTIARVVKDLARQLEPFPRPTVTEVKIGKQVLREDAASYLRLTALRGKYVLGDGRPVGIRLGSPTETPWTARGMLYYPDNDVLLVSPATSIRLPAELAADIEAARPLGAGDGGSTRIPWIPIAVGVAGSLWLALRGALRRGRPERPYFVRLRIQRPLFMSLA